MTGVTVYLGTHQPNWLARLTEPLFVSRRRLAGRKSLPRARGPWALDSGGFTELSQYGEWRVGPREYVAEVRRFAAEVGGLRWAAIQDWMCEPFMLQRTGLSVAEHQRRTVASYLALRDMAPELPWAPVLQGWEPDDYLRCLDAYATADVDVRSAPVVGLGSICRRQQTDEAEHLVRHLAGLGLRIHGFGFKLKGLARTADVLHSSDSLAWSFDARHRPPLPECSGHKNCANCERYALRWLARARACVGEALS